MSLTTRDLVSVFTYLAEFWIAYLYFGSIFERKRSKGAVILIGLSIYTAGLVQFVFLYNLLLNLTVSFLRNILFLFLCHRAKPVKGVLSCIAFDVLTAVTEWFTMLLTSMVTKGGINQLLEGTASYFVMVVICKTLLLLACLLLARFVLSRGTDGAARTPVFLFLLPTCAIFLFMTIWKAMTETPSIRLYAAVGSTALFVSVLLSFILYGSAMRRNEELFRLQSAYEKAQTDKEYYAILDKRNEEVRLFIHDEKNRLAVLQSMDDADEIHRYVEQILGELQDVSPVGNTQNKMLDLVLGKYDAQCRMRGVRFSYATLTANLSFMEDVDLVALLGNVLDNAVEAAQNAEDKWIELSVESKVAGVTTLTCENSAQNAPLTRGGLLRTTKENAAHHGVGVKSVSRIAKKYDGKYDWSWDEDKKIFTARVTFER